MNHCDKVYHMKCISIVPEEMEAINNNSSEWICRKCLMHMFPFNSTNDDSKFVQLCSNEQNHGCQISDLLYNPYDSNAKEYMGFQDFDPDTNFYIKKTYTMDYYATNILRIHSMPKLTVWLMLRLICLHYAIWIFAVLTEIFPILKTICSYWKSISQLLVSQLWFVCLSGDNVIESHHENKTGGGVGLFLDNNINQGQQKWFECV